MTMTEGERNRILLSKLRRRYGRDKVVVYQNGKTVCVLLSVPHSVEAVTFATQAFELQKEPDERLLVRFNQPLQFDIVA